MPEDITNLLGDLGANLDANPPADNNPPADDANNNATVPPAEEKDTTPNAPATGEGNETNEGNSSADDNNQELDLNNPTNKAFAELRTTNKKYTDFFKKIQDATGATEEQIMDALMQQVNAQQAQQHNTSPEIWNKIQEQEERLQSYELRENERRVAEGLGLLQRELKLDNKQIERFVREATSKGYNLFDSRLNYETLYRGMFYQELLDKEIEARRQEELSRQAKANDHSTSPAKVAGAKNEGGKQEIKNVSDLNNLLGSLKKD